MDGPKAERAFVTLCVGGAVGEVECTALVELLAHRGHVVFWLVGDSAVPHKVGSAAVAQVSEIKRGVNLVMLASPCVYQDVLATVRGVYHRAGAIDALLCFTGGVHIAPFEETGSNPELELLGAATTMCVIKSVLGRMRRRRKGKIVFLGDISSNITYPGAAVHAAATCSLFAFGKSLRLEVHPFGIDVTFITTSTFRLSSSTATSTHIEDYDLLRGWLHWLHSGRRKTLEIDASASQKIVDHVGFQGRTFSYQHWIGVNWRLRAFVGLRSLIPAWIADWLYSRTVQNPYGPFHLAREPVARAKA